MLMENKENKQRQKAEEENQRLMDLNAQEEYTKMLER
jgi:hypothetical protein